MIFYLSPSKKLTQSNKPTTPLLFPQPTLQLLTLLNHLTKAQLAKIIKASPAITEKAYQDYQQPIDLGPALFVYSGEAFKSLHPISLNQQQLDYLEEHCLIGSALFGISKPSSQLFSHRLDLTMTLPFKPTPLTIYKPLIAKYLKDQLIVNVASQEYAQLLDRNKLNIVDTEFYDHGQIVSVYAKQARGELVRQAALNQVTTIDQLQKLKVFNYRSRVFENKLIFERD